MSSPGAEHAGPTAGERLQSAIAGGDGESSEVMMFVATLADTEGVRARAARGKYLPVDFSYHEPRG